MTSSNQKLFSITRLRVLALCLILAASQIQILLAVNNDYITTSLDLKDATKPFCEPEDGFSFSQGMEPCIEENPADDWYDFSIYFTGSVRGKAMPMFEGNNLACTVEQAEDKLQDCRGGCAFRLALREHLKSSLLTNKSRQLITVDTGSYWWGSAYSHTDSSYCLSQTEYDVIGLGYTDFFEGSADLAEFISALRPETMVVSTNANPKCDRNICVTRGENPSDKNCLTDTPVCQKLEETLFSEFNENNFMSSREQVDEISSSFNSTTGNYADNYTLFSEDDPKIQEAIKNMRSQTYDKNSHMFTNYHIVPYNPLEGDKDQPLTRSFNYIIVVSLVMKSTFTMPKARSMSPLDPDIYNYYASMLTTLDEARATVTAEERKQGLDLLGNAPVVLLTDLPHSEAQSIGRNIRGVAAVLCNDWSTTGFYSLSNSYGSKLVFGSVPENGIQVGLLNLAFNADGSLKAFAGKFIQATREISHYGDSLHAQEVHNHFIERTKELNRRLKDSVGYTDTPLSAFNGSTDIEKAAPTIETTGCREFDCALGRLVVDAYRLVCIPYLKKLCDVGFINSGAFRGSLPGGKITVGDIENLVPFRNNVVLVSITGEQLLAAIGNGINLMFSDELSGAFPQTNLKIVFNPHKTVTPIQERVVEVRFPKDYKDPPHLRFGMEAFHELMSMQSTENLPPSSLMFNVQSEETLYRQQLKPFVDPQAFFDLIRTKQAKLDSEEDTVKEVYNEENYASAEHTFSSMAGLGASMFDMMDMGVDISDESDDLPSIDNLALYWVAVPHYIYSGGDQYYSLMNPAEFRIAEDETSVITSYVKRFNETHPYNGLARQTLERCLTNEPPWATAREGDCYTMVTNLTASTAVFCATDAAFCESEAKKHAEMYSIPFNPTACSQCSGMGTCSRRICTCNESEDPLYQPLPMVVGDRCNVIREVVTVTRMTRFIVLPSFLFVFFVCATFAILLIRFRKRRVIRAVSPKLGVLMCIGGCLTSTSTFFDVLEPSPIPCTAMMWLLNLGISMTFCTLFLRAYRIHRIFNVNMNSPVRRKVHTDMNLIQRVGICVAANLVLLGILAATAPISLSLENISTKTAERGLLLCSSKNNALAISIVVINVPLLFWGMFLAIKTRRVEANYNESTYISVSIYNCFVVVIISVPLYLTLVKTIPESAQILRNLAILYVTLFTMCAVYLPRFLKLGRESSETAQQETSFISGSVQLLENAYIRSSSRIPLVDDDAPGKDLTALEEDALVDYIRMLEGSLNDYGIPLPDEVNNSTSSSLPSRAPTASHQQSVSPQIQPSSSFSFSHNSLFKPKNVDIADKNQNSNLSSAIPEESSLFVVDDFDAPNVGSLQSIPSILSPEYAPTPEAKVDEKLKSMFARSSIYTKR